MVDAKQGALQQIALICCRLLLAAGGLLCLPGGVCAAAAAVEIDHQRVIDLTPHVEILPDREGLLQLRQVLTRDGHFVPFPTDRLSLSTDNTAYWLRFTLVDRQPAAQGLLLSLLPANLDYVDLFQLADTGGGVLAHRQAGLAYPNPHRNVRQAGYLFPLAQAGTASATYYLRLQSDRTINLAMRLGSPAQLLGEGARTNWWAGHLFGVLSLLIVVNLLQLRRDKNRNPLWYSGFLLLAALYVATWWGYTADHLPATVALDLITAALSYGALLCYSEFSRGYFETRRYFANWDLALRVFTGLAASGLALTLLVPINTSAVLNAAIAAGGMLLFFTLGLFAVFQGMRRAQGYTLARAITTPVILCYILSRYQFLPWSHHIFWLLLAAICIEGTVMTYALIQQSISRFNRRMRRHYEATLQRDTRRRDARTLRRINDEIRTPVSGVIGMAELLLDTTLSRSQRDQVLTIRRAGHSLLRWLTRLGDWSALRHDRVRLESVPFELKALLEEFVEDCRERAEDRKASLRLQLDPRLPQLLRGDPQRLKQILAGIFEHALYYSEQGELLLQVRPAGTKDHWWVELLDNQSSLQAGEVAALVSADSDGGGTAAEQFALPQRDWFVAQRLCARMGGRLSLELAGASTARYRCELKMARHTLMTRSEADYNDLLRDRRLLVVDDSPSSRKVVSKRADRWGMRVTGTPSASDALALLRKVAGLGGRFDLIILDCDMPGMSGLELAARIDSDPQLRDTTVIMLSGAGRVPAPEEALAVGVRRVLQKPVSAKTLKITLAEELTLALARRPDRRPRRLQSAMTARSRAQ